MTGTSLLPEIILIFRIRDTSRYLGKSFFLALQFPFVQGVVLYFTGRKAAASEAMRVKVIVRLRFFRAGDIRIFWCWQTPIL